VSPVRNVTVLISGTGSNLQAMIDAVDAGRLEIRINHVISNVADAPGLQRAANAGIRSSVLEHGRFAERGDFDAALALLMAAGEPDLVVLAGFMRIIGEPVLNAFRGKMINLHPALLPKYRGVDTYRRALEAGDDRHGASMHFVTEELDGGPVLSQVIIPIQADDNPETLAARLSPREHELVVATVAFFTRHDVACDGGTIRVDGATIRQPFLLQPDGALHV
jgi:phosphoribosylglycinamide formyltransferase-1